MQEWEGGLSQAGLPATTIFYLTDLLFRAPIKEINLATWLKSATMTACIQMNLLMWQLIMTNVLIDVITG